MRGAIKEQVGAASGRKAHGRGWGTDAGWADPVSGGLAAGSAVKVPERV